MKLTDVILLSLAVVFLVIGVHQVITIGFGMAYWSIMIALLLFFVFTLRKKKHG